MIDDGEPAEFCSEREVQRARTAHTCYECNRTILAGESYTRTVAKWDGEFHAHARCVHCTAAAVWLQKHCNGYLYGGVLEDLREHWEEGYDYKNVDRLGRLIIGMRRQWKAFRAEGLLPVPSVPQ